MGRKQAEYRDDKDLHALKFGVRRAWLDPPRPSAPDVSGFDLRWGVTGHR